jgi:hypothetical protein
VVIPGPNAFTGSSKLKLGNMNALRIIFYNFNRRCIISFFPLMFHVLRASLISYVFVPFLPGCSPFWPTILLQLTVERFLSDAVCRRLGGTAWVGQRTISMILPADYDKVEEEGGMRPEGWGQYKCSFF